MLYRKGQYPSKEEATKLYITDNLSISALSKVWGFSCKKVRTVLRMYNISKSREMQLQSQYETNIRKYGNKCPYCNKEVKQKWLENNKKKYGVEYPFQLKKFQDKQKQTLIERYNITNISKKKEYRERVIQTNLQKYGGIAPMCNDEIKKKSKQTRIDRYGEDYGKVIMNKSKQTCLIKYGTVYPMQNDKVKQKILDKMPQTVIKTAETKRRNKSFTTSAPEETVFNLLKSEFTNVERQYRTEKYPFNCDFYVPDIDTYIEFNGTWLHGDEPYDKSSKEHKDKLSSLLLKSNKLADKGKRYNLYTHAIYVWTDLDVRKRQTAARNNLNYLEFFNIEQVKEWLKERKCHQ